jgi:putative redox protein
VTAPETTTGAPATPAPKPPAQVRVTWAGDRRFDAGRPDGPTIRLDGNAATGPSPVDALASALAACIAVDVVDILAKRRTPAASLTVDVTAERANATPARVVRAELRFRIAGAGIERVHAERAIELAATKYCSVGSSLNPDIPVTWTLELEGEGR